MKNQTKIKEESNGRKETNYLLSNLVNAEHLKQAIREIKMGQTFMVKLEDL